MGKEEKQFEQFESRILAAITSVREDLTSTERRLKEGNQKLELNLRQAIRAENQRSRDELAQEIREFGDRFEERLDRHHRGLLEGIDVIGGNLLNRKYG